MVGSPYVDGDTIPEYQLTEILKFRNEVAFISGYLLQRGTNGSMHR